MEAASFPHHHRADASSVRRRHCSSCRSRYQNDSLMVSLPGEDTHALALKKVDDLVQPGQEHVTSFWRNSRPACRHSMKEPGERACQAVTVLLYAPLRVGLDTVEQFASFFRKLCLLPSELLAECYFFSCRRC